jgi:hypothetical protein
MSRYFMTKNGNERLVKTVRIMRAKAIWEEGSFPYLIRIVHPQVHIFNICPVSSDISTSYFPGKVQIKMKKHKLRMEHSYKHRCLLRLHTHASRKECLQCVF